MKVPNGWKAALLLFFIFTASGCNHNAPPPNEPAEVSYSMVSEERIILESDMPGRVAAFVVSEVRPQVDGIIRERTFQEGADVLKGQILYRIEPSAYQAAYNTAKASLIEAQANAEGLALLEKRYRILVVTKAVSRQDLDNAISDHAQARARVARAQAELESAAIELDYTKVKAPVSGRIGASSVTPGALVSANQSEPLAVIRQTKRVYVNITQSSADIIRLRRAMAQGKMSSNGGATKVHLKLEDGTPYTSIRYNPEDGVPKWIKGDLLFSEISVSQTTGSVVLRAVFDNPDGLLLPGMYVKATVEEGVLDKAVLIPQRCVLTGGTGGHFVYLLKKDATGDGLFRIVRRDITIERSLGNRWIVKSGLSAGELLVIEGLQKAVPDQVVKAVPFDENLNKDAVRAGIIGAR
jgi:membrane fusion protein (multidrug efflux system)